MFDLEHPPLFIGADVLAEAEGVSLSAIYKRIKRGEFDHLRATGARGTKPFSGILLAKSLRGEPLYVPTFGRKRSA